MQLIQPMHAEKYKKRGEKTTNDDPPGQALSMGHSAFEIERFGAFIHHNS